jgi:hypothetical protein
MFSKVTRIKVRIGKNLSDAFLIQNNLTQGNVSYCCYCFSTLLWNTTREDPKKLGGIELDIKVFDLCRQ